MKLSSTLTSLATDLLNILLLMGLSWFMVSWLVSAHSVGADSETWYSTAFKIKTLTDQGLVAWTPAWGLGTALWKNDLIALPLLSSFISKFFEIDALITMMRASMVVFCFSRVLIYSILRKVGITPLGSLVAATLTLSGNHQWLAMSNYAGFISLFLLLLLIAVWIKSVTDKNWFLLFSAAVGAAWGISPELGFFALMLWIASLLLVHQPQSISWFLAQVFSVIMASSPRWSVLFLENNSLFSLETAKIESNPTLVPASLSVIFLFLLGWLGNGFWTRKLSQWSKVGVLFTSIFWIGLIVFSTAVSDEWSMYIYTLYMYLTFFLVICVSQTIFIVLEKFSEKWRFIVAGLVLGLLVIESSVVSLEYSPKAASKIDVWGSYTISDSSAYQKRWLLPYPGPSLLGSNSKIISISAPTQDYARTNAEEVLYRFTGLTQVKSAFPLVIPAHKPIIADYLSTFSVTSIWVPTDSEQQKIYQDIGYKTLEQPLTSKGKVAIMEKPENKTLLEIETTAPDNQWLFDILPSPEISDISYAKYDQVIRSISEKKAQKESSATLDFNTRDQIKISSFSNTTRLILLPIAYDNLWFSDDAQILETAIGTIAVVVPEEASSDLILHYKWPVWFWIIQSFGVATLSVCMVYILIFSKPRTTLNLSETEQV